MGAGVQTQGRVVVFSGASEQHGLPLCLQKHRSLQGFAGPPLEPGTLNCRLVPWRQTFEWP